MSRRDATEILSAHNLAGKDRKEQLDLATFTKVFGLANTAIPDERDTAARQEMSLTSFYRRQLAEESSYTMPAEEVARRKMDITRYQVHTGARRIHLHIKMSIQPITNHQSIIPASYLALKCSNR
jgi:hypothetical protein